MNYFEIDSCITVQETSVVELLREWGYVEYANKLYMRYYHLKRKDVVLTVIIYDMETGTYKIISGGHTVFDGAIKDAAFLRQLAEAIELPTIRKEPEYERVAE